MMNDTFTEQRTKMFRELNGAPSRRVAAGPLRHYEGNWDGITLMTVARNEASARSNMAWQIYERMSHRWDLRECLAAAREMTLRAHG